MTTTFWVRAGALLMLAAVGAGAFGAHALKNRLPEDLKAVYETGVRYHAYHALGLLAVAWLTSRSPSGLTAASGWCFLAGIVLFSGSLYALSLSGVRWLGAITPIGGVLFLAGWACLAAGAR